MDFTKLEPQEKEIFISLMIQLKVRHKLTYKELESLLYSNYALLKLIVVINTIRKLSPKLKC